MSVDELESALADQVAQRYRARGFEVFRNPEKNLLPEELDGIRPDLIAFRGSDKILIEIAVGRPEDFERAKKIRSLLKGRTDWKFVLYTASREDSQLDLHSIDKDSLFESINAAKSLLDGGFYVQALLQCWSVLEGLARYIDGDTFRRPQSPLRVVEKLAHAGEITPSDARFLRSLVQTRNRYVHGDRYDAIDKLSVQKFIDLLELIITPLKPTNTPS